MEYYSLLLLLFVGLLLQARIHGVEAASAWRNARATFYGTNQDPSTLGGACSYENTYVAGFGVYTTALSAPLFRGGQACGACYQLMCNSRAERRWCLPRGSITVTTTNFCPPNNLGGWCNSPRHHFDLSLPAFLHLAREAADGVVPVLYRRVPCKRSGGVRFTLKGQSNFNIVRISNVGGSGEIKNVWIRGSRTRKTWIPMHRNWGANWQSGIDVRSQTLSFRVQLGDRKILEFNTLFLLTGSMDKLSPLVISSTNEYLRDI